MFHNWYDRSARSTEQHRGVIVTAQIDWELRELIKVYDKLQPKHVLEIGSQYGGTLYYWLEGADKGSVVVNIDILQNMNDTERERLPMQWATWAPVGVVQHSIIGRSDDAKVFRQVVKYLDGWIDFLFIDAVHTYEGAKFDFLTYGPLVRPGGMIVFHDLMTPEFSPHIQVGKLWREIQAAGYVTRELRAAEGAAFGSIGIVYV